MTTRPLASLCVITYNQEKFVAEAVKAALSQSYRPLEVILSDDASSDDTFKIMSTLEKQYDGDLKIVLNRNKSNLGLACHVNKLIHSVASGEFIALAAGDDVSMSDRIEKSISFLEHNPAVMAVSTSLTTIDHAGSVIKTTTNTCNKTTTYTLDDYLTDAQLHINGPSRTFRRVIPDTFGPLGESCPTEDSTYLLRCFLSGKVAMLAEQLVHYRQHDASMSAPCNIQNLSVNSIQEQYLKDIATAETRLGLDIETRNKLLKRIERNIQNRKHAFRHKKRRGMQFLSWLANKLHRITSKKNH